MKKLIWLITIAVAIGLYGGTSLAAASITLNPVNVDYNTGTISISGVLGTGSGKRVTVEVKNAATGELAYSDQITSTAHGKFALSFKVSRKYSTGTYNVSVSGSDVNDAAVTTFDFDASRDIYGANNVSVQGAVNGKAEENTTLTGVYDFYSSFGYNEGASAYQWQIGSVADGQFYDISGANAKTYKFTRADAERILASHPELFPADVSQRRFYVKFNVKVITETSNVFAETQSSDAVEVMTLPYALNPAIEGSGVAGEQLTGKYEYGHLQGKRESRSEYSWLRADTEYGTYSEVAKGISYIPTAQDVGKYIKFMVIPKSDEQPFTGLPAISDKAVLIKKNTSKGGSPGGGGGDKGSTVSVKGDIDVLPTPISLPTPIPGTQKKRFEDIPDGYWAKKDIEDIVARGQANGVSDTSFAPDKSVTRAQFAKLVLNVLNKSESQYAGNFKDVDKDAWYAGVVQTASDIGLISGSDGYFRPDDPITREEMAKIVIEAYKIVKGNAPAGQDVDTFADRQDISTWAAEYINSACKLGLVNGMPDGRFAPKESATRAQAVVIANRLYNALKTE